MAKHVVQVVRSDADTHILLSVTAGTRQKLDLQIEGTEGTTPFVASFKHHRLNKLLQKTSNLSDEEWDIILTCTLLQERTENSSQTALLANIELSAHVTRESLVLTFRKNISGIHQRIAEIPLPRNEDHELDTIAWVSTAAERSRSLEAELQAALLERDAQQAANAKLHRQLEELVQAKLDHENDLLARFTRLLNTKKLKIRNLQRLLSSNVAPSDRSKLPASEDEDVPERGSPQGKRAAKRKPTHDSASKHGKGVEDGNESADTSTQSDQQTPNQSDEETATEDEDKDEDEDEDDLDTEQSLPDGQRTGRAQPAKPSFISTLGSTNASSDDTPPPRRILPFAAARSAGSDNRKAPKPLVGSRAQRKGKIPEGNPDGPRSADSDQEL